MSQRSLRAIPVLLVAVLVAGPIAHAQWTPMPLPPESPYWWTLSDEVTPSQLRRALQDRDANRARARQNLEDGKEHGLVTEEDIHRVSAYLDGGQTPELVPMYIALEAFASRFEHRTNWEKDGPELLHRYGMSSEGSSRLVAVVHDYREHRDEIIAEVTPSVVDLMRILRPLKLGSEKIDSLLVAGEMQELSRLTGKDTSQLARLHRQWKREPLVEAALPRLLELRRELAATDWSAFRAFLLHEVAPMIKGIDYQEDSDQ